VGEQTGQEQGNTQGRKINSPKESLSKSNYKFKDKGREQLSEVLKGMGPVFILDPSPLWPVLP
jgi:hypothetical protein